MTTKAQQAAAQSDRHPLLSGYDPDVAQTEMVTAADKLLAAAMRRLAALERKDDPDAYDRAVADVRAARTALAGVKMFGPGA